MGEELPIGRPDDPVPPRVVPDTCPACGRHRGGWWLTWGEAYRRYGHARVTCMTCLLTDIPRTATMP